jgi:hypothetical protein
MLIAAIGLYTCTEIRARAVEQWLRPLITYILIIAIGVTGLHSWSIYYTFSDDNARPRNRMAQYPNGVLTVHTNHDGVELFRTYQVAPPDYILAPEVFNTDQGVRLTALEFTGCLEAAGIRISMDGRGRAWDNIFIERLWRSVKYVELLDLHLRRIERYNPRLNAIISPDYEQGRHVAETADAARGRGEDRPLLGLPLTLKDSINVNGLRTTVGMPEWAEARVDFDDPLTNRLRAAGAVILAGLDRWATLCRQAGTRVGEAQPALLGDLRHHHQVYSALLWTNFRVP